jgi:hypothetical protein
VVPKFLFLTKSKEDQLEMATAMGGIGILKFTVEVFAPPECDLTWRQGLYRGDQVQMRVSPNLILLVNGHRHTQERHLNKKPGVCLARNAKDCRKPTEAR